MNKLSIYKKGTKDGLPICFGYLAVSFAFGIQASSAGLSALQAVIMSLTNVTSAGQFASLSIIAAGASLLELAITQLILNLRYLLMSCALSQKLSYKTSTLSRLLVAHGVTDEIFGVSVSVKGELSPFYNYGLMTVSIFGWCFGTLLGVISGDLLPFSVTSALGIAIYGMFIAIVVPDSKKDKHILFAALLAIALSCILKYAPVLSGISSGFQIIIATIIAATCAAIFFPVEDEKDE